MIVYQYLHYLHTTNILSTPNNYTEYLHHLLTIYGPQAWDPVMLKHSCLCGDETLHPESPGRLERILAAVAEAGLLTRCELVRRTATLEELCSVHAPQVNIYSISRYIYIYMSTHLHIYISTYLHIYPARVPARHESAGARHPGPGRDAAAVRRLGRGHRHRLERHPHPHRRQGRRRVRHRARQ